MGKFFFLSPTNRINRWSIEFMDLFAPIELLEVQNYPPRIPFCPGSSTSVFPSEFRAPSSSASVFVFRRCRCVRSGVSSRHTLWGIFQHILFYLFSCRRREVVLWNVFARTFYSHQRNVETGFFSSHLTCVKD